MQLLETKLATLLEGSSPQTPRCGGSAPQTPPAGGLRPPDPKANQHNAGDKNYNNNVNNDRGNGHYNNHNGGYRNNNQHSYGNGGKGNHAQPRHEPKRLICWTCNAPGHAANDCPNADSKLKVVARPMVAVQNNTTKGGKGTNNH